MAKQIFKGFNIQIFTYFYWAFRPKHFHLSTEDLRRSADLRFTCKNIVLKSLHENT